MENTTQFVPNKPNSLLNNELVGNKTLNSCASNWWKYGLTGGAITGGTTLLVLRYGRYLRKLSY